MSRRFAPLTAASSESITAHSTCQLRDQFAVIAAGGHCFLVDDWLLMLLLLLLLLSLVVLVVVVQGRGLNQPRPRVG